MAQFLIGFVFLVLGFAQPSFAQSQPDEDWHLDRLTVVTGRGVLSSGLYGEVAIEKGDFALEAAADSGQGWFAYVWKPTKSVQVAMTGGIMMNTPWFGPRVSWEPVKGLTLMTWPGWSIGPRFGEPDWELNFGVKPLFIFYTTGPLTVSYNLVKFEENETWHLPGVALTKKVGEHYTLLAGFDYNRTERDKLFRIALTFSP